MRVSIVCLLLAACWPTTPEPLRYTVVRGDTLGEIATAHGVTVDELRAWNHIDGDLIEVGQILEIPAAGQPGPGPVTAAPRSRRGPRKRSPPPSETKLVMPPLKPCLSGPSTTAEGDGMTAVASQGLTKAQINAAVDAFLPQTTSCVVGDSGTIDLELTIACSGRVESAVVISDSGLPDGVLGCVANRMKYAAFPAHALPDGDRVRIPLTYRYTPHPTEAPPPGSRAAEWGRQ